MATTLPKPTTPKPAAPAGAAAAKPPVSGADTTIFQKSPAKPLTPAPVTSAPAAPVPTPTAKPPSLPPVQLGGRTIPVPKPAGNPLPPAARPELKAPTAPLPLAAPTPTQRESKLGINPALAPKPAAPLQPASLATPAAGPGSSSAAASGAAGSATTAKPLRAPFATQPLIAQIMANPKKWLLIALGAILGIVLVSTLIKAIFGNRSAAPATQTGTAAPTQQTVLTYWGLWEPSAVLDEVIAEYEQANPGVKIDYRVQSHRDYRERLQTAIASGNGPDIFRYHASWVPMLSGDLAVLPASVMTANDFQTAFYPAAAQQLQVEGRIVGLPLMYDGLGLYYNTDILQTAGVSPPTTWAELKQLASELTVPADKNERRNAGIQRSGLAIGNASNVDHFSDILTLLILQNGGDPAEPTFAEVRDALTFYTNFVTEDAVWDSTLPGSTLAFARGDAAMMFAPTWRAHEILELNPSLHFAVAPVPQLSDDAVALANYWAEGVNERSSHKTEAWKFLGYLASPEVMRKLSSAQAQVRAFGEPYSRTDLASQLADDPYVGAVLQDAPIAQGWYMNSATHDNGLNDQVMGYYAAAVNSILAGQSVEEVTATLSQGVKQTLRQYGLSQ